MEKGNALARAFQRSFGWMKRSANIPKTVWTLYSLRTQINFGHLDAYAKVGWVNRCVRTIATNLQQVPVYGVRRVQGRGRGRLQRLPDIHPMAQLLMRPQPEDDFASLVELTSTYLDLYGESLWEMDSKGPKSPPTAIHIYPSQSLTRVEVDDWRYQKFHMYLNGVEIQVDGRDAVFHKLVNPVNPWRGMSPLNAAFVAADVDYASQMFNARFFQNAPTPGLVLGYDSNANVQRLDPAEQERMRAQIKQFHAGLGNAFGVMVLGPGQNIKDVGNSSKDMHFEALRKFNRDEICAVFGVPPIMLGIVENANRSNSQDQIRMFWEDTLIPRIEDMSSLMNRRISPRFGNDIQIVWDVLSVPAMRTDLKAIADGVVPLINVGALTINEVRVEYLDKEPVPWGDENWHQSTLVADSDLGGEDTENEKPVKSITPEQAKGVLLEWKNAALSRINEGAKSPMEAFPVGREAKKLARRLKVPREQAFLMAKTAFTELAVSWDRFAPEDTVVEVFERAIDSLPKGEEQTK